MSFITFQCYACNQSLKVGSDKAGRKAKCHKCGTILTIPIASAAPPAARETSRRPTAPPPIPAVSAEPTPVAPLEDEEDYRPRRRRRDDEDEYEEPRSRRRRDEARDWD